MRWPAPVRRVWRRLRRPPQIVGYVDRAAPRVVAGWAADHAEPGQTVLVLLVLDGRPVAAEPADRYRLDLEQAGIGQGRHGYAIPTPNFRADAAERLEVFALRFRKARQIGLVDERGDLVRGLDAPAFDRMREAAGAGQVALLRSIHLREPPYAARPECQRAMDGPLTLLDIEDLLVFLEENTRVTGIQRVVLGLVRTSLLSPGRHPPFEFCILTRTGDVIVLPRGPLLAFAERGLFGSAGQADLLDGVLGLRAAGLRVSLRPGDRFVATGAYWIIDDYGRAMLRLRARGVQIGAYVYDLIPITHGALVTASTRETVLERAYELFAVADFFLAISDFVARELRGILVHEMGRRPWVRTVSLPHELPGASEAEDGPDGSVHSRPFVLCVGTLEARKNQILLAQVWAGLIRKHGRDAVPDLVLVGRWGWGSEALREFCESTGYVGGRLVVKAGIGDRELAALYRQCLFTAFPSFLEGWGLPVGEGLAVCKLCVAANTTSVPEVGGSFVDYFDPHDYLDAFTAIERAILDEAYRAGREREIAEAFHPRTWQDTTDAFHAVVASLADEARSEGRGVPLLDLGTEYTFSRLMTDPLRPWPSKAAKLALLEGWHDEEGDVAWARRPEAVLRFHCDVPSGTALCVTLRLEPAPGVAQAEMRAEGRGQSYSILLEPPRPVGLAEYGKHHRPHAEEHKVHAPDPQEVRFETPAGEGGCVIITLRGDPRDARREGMRDLYFGLSALSASYAGGSHPAAD